MNRKSLIFSILMFFVFGMTVFATPISDGGENIIISEEKQTEAPVQNNINVDNIQVEDIKKDNIKPNGKKSNNLKSNNTNVNNIKLNDTKSRNSKKDSFKKDANAINVTQDFSKEVKIQDNMPKTDNINVEIKETNSKIFSESTARISAVYPIDNPQNNYPGYRGVNQLVIYYPEFGYTTGTNEYGKEAVVVDGIVTSLTGANSIIPRANGYVISGHGSAKKWITDNLKVGTKVDILGRTLRAYTTIDSYRYCAKTKIDEVQSIISALKFQDKIRDDRKIYQHLKKAKQKYKKSLKSDPDLAYTLAQEAIQEATLAFRYALPCVKNEFRGTWIRPETSNINEIKDTLDKMKEAGINNVFIETFFHGKTIFPSRTMREYGFEEQNSQFRGVDVLGIWVSEAHKRNIKVHCWFESFYVGNKLPQNNPKSILAVKPEWSNRTRRTADSQDYVSHPQEHNGYFLDPANPDVITFLVNLIDEITTRYSIDGVNIDYVRYPNIAKENYGNQWGYTKFAREEFKMLYEVDPVELTKDDSLFGYWCEYRYDKITDYIKKVSIILRKKKIMFSAVIFPDYKISMRTKFQDWTRWAHMGYVDAFTPLILTSDDALAKSMLEEIKRKSNDVKIYPGLFAGFIESDPEDLLKQILMVRSLELNGVILFDWAHLNSNYLDVLKASVFKIKDVK